MTRLAGAIASGNGWQLACAMTGKGCWGGSGATPMSGVNFLFALGLAGTACGRQKGVKMLHMGFTFTTRDSWLGLSACQSHAPPASSMRLEIMPLMFMRGNHSIDTCAGNHRGLGLGGTFSEARSSREPGFWAVCAASSCMSSCLSLSAML